jgi:hypothetical protein
MPVILATSEAEIKKIMVQGQPGQIVHETISKTTRAKWIGGVTPAVEHLLCKHKALSSNPSSTKYIQIYIYVLLGAKKGGSRT